MAQAANKIHLRGLFQALELPAGGNVPCGSLLLENSSGQVVVHGTAGGAAERMFANEDALQGLAPDTQYTLGNMVNISSEEPGNIVNALLAPTYNYAIGNFLISNGDGTLKPTTGTPVSIIGVVIQALNLSGSGAVATLNPVRIM